MMVADGAPLPLTSDGGLPTRMLNWARRNGIDTLQQLARRNPEALLRERNLGLRSIAQTRLVIQRELGSSWEALAEDDEACPNVAGPGDEPRPFREASRAGPADPNRWDDLRRMLPASLLELPLDDLALSARLRSFVRRRRLSTVGELARLSKAELMSTRNLARLSVVSLVEALRARLGEGAALVPLPAPGEPGSLELPAPANLLAIWESVLSAQKGRRRAVFDLRASGLPSSRTLRSVAAALGMSHHAVHAVEASLLRAAARRTSPAAMQQRIQAALVDGSVGLATLAADPWWAGAAADPALLDYLGKHMFRGAFRVVAIEEIEGGHCLARCTQKKLAESWPRLLASAYRVPLPATPAAFEALVEPLRGTLGAALVLALQKRLARLLSLRQGPHGPQVVGLGGAREAVMLDTLRASPEPIRLEILGIHVARADLPPEVLFFGSRTVGLERHFPDFAAWMARLVPRALELLEDQGVARQVSTGELREKLAAEVELPDWLSEWHLESLLRRSGKALYLGHGRVALPGASEGGRLRYREELVRILREHGCPMVRRELVAKVRKSATLRRSTETTVLADPAFVRCARGLIGLRARDVPGGAKAQEMAARHVAKLLAERGRGLSAADLQAELSPLSPALARWSRELCVSVLGGDPRFRGSPAGAVGLSSWESVRLPTRAELLTEGLEAGGGTMRFSTLRSRIRKVYGKPPGRESFGSLLGRVGVSRRGEWLAWGPRKAATSGPAKT